METYIKHLHGAVLSFCIHSSASFISPCLLIGPFICDYSPFVLAHSSPFPSFHSSIPLSFCPSVYVALSVLARASLFPCWFAASSPTPLFSLLFTHPHLPRPPLLLPILHVCQGPGGSALCTAQWPKSEYLRNCQLSPIIRGSP